MSSKAPANQGLPVVRMVARAEPGAPVFSASPSVRTDPARNDHQPGSETSRLAAFVAGHPLVAQAARRGDYATPTIALAVRRVWNGPCGISGGAKLSELARSQRLYQSASSGNSFPPSRNPSGR